MSDLWYYAQGEEPVGPLSLADLTTILSKAPTSKDVLVWRDGFAGWQRAGDVPELARFIVKPPPVRPPASQLPPVRPPQPPPPTFAGEPTVVQPDPKKQNTSSFGGKVLGYGASIITFIASFALVREMGGVVLAPLLLIGLAFWGLKYTKISSAIVPTLSITIGQCLWFVIGAFYLLTSNGPDLDFLMFAIEIVIVAVLVSWVIKTQSQRSVICLLIYQVFGLSMTLFNLLAVTEPQVALCVHVTMRLLEIGFSVYALAKLRERSLVAA
jgi:hypothetical protein